MFFFTENDWLNRGIDNELHRFFLLVWKEIFDELTPDTWQVRTSNILTVLRELIQTVEIATEFDGYKYNIPVLLNEAKEMLGVDPVIAKYFPFVTAYLPSATGPDSFPKDLSALGHTCTVILGALRDYHKHAISELRELLLPGNEKEKGLICRLAMAFAVERLGQGYSIEYLRRGVDCSIRAARLSFIEKLDQFAASCTGENIRYMCRFSISWPGSIPPAGFHGLGITLDRRPAEPMTEVQRTFYGTRSNENDVFAVFTVDAKDSYSASRGGEERLANLFAVVNSSVVQGRFNIKGTHSIVAAPDGPERLIKIIRSRNPDVSNDADSAHRVGELLDLERTLQADDWDQLISALQYHRLALTAATDEAQLVNLWIALECLVHHRRRSIVEDVCEYAASSIAVGKVRRIVQNVADYVGWNWRDSANPNMALFPRSDPKEIHPRDMLDAVMDTKDGEKINEIYRIIGSSHLTRYRVHLLRKQLLGSSGQAIQMLDSHFCHVDWQLRRIYRARNHVMHRGKAMLVVPQLNRHLHGYFLTTLKNLVNDLRGNVNWSIHDALIHRTLLFKHYRKAIETRSITRAALLDPEAVLFGKSDVRAWEP
ncbi:MAG TPA: hypothetical protein VFC78_02525 [Tepidisphaeraceae bacterium]|nr:hypothetical protein [Tepidisphaeraceae bacterium]